MQTSVSTRKNHQYALHVVVVRFVNINASDSHAPTVEGVQCVNTKSKKPHAATVEGVQFVNIT